mmetsp:Transcript_29131/g.36123  ORF Transcript_29131/g.36123 Transcript_29131/m.36123 type:complete len:306 (-) Transcript_29131:176-1093(-)
MHGSHEGASSHGVADSHVLVRFDHASNEGVIDRVVEEDSAEGRAPLTTSADSGEYGTLKSEFQVRIWHDDRGVVASELEDGVTEAAVDVSADAAAHSSATREGDEGHARVLHHGISDGRAIASDDRHDAVEAIGFQHVRDDFTEGDGDHGNGISTLPDDLVTAYERKGSVPAADSDGEVEGSDDADVANGVPDLHHKVAGALRVQNFAVDRSGHTDSHIADIDELLHLAETLRADLAHLESDEGAESVLLCSESLSDLSDDLAADGSGRGLPPGLLLGHSLDALLIVRDRGALGLRHQLVVVGVA